VLLVPSALTLVVTGSFVTAAGPHPGSSGDKIPRLGNVVDAAHVHAVANGVFGVCLAICLLALVWRRREARTELLLGMGVLALLGVEMGVGRYQWDNALPWGVVLLHVALATAVWTGLVTLVVRLVWAAGIRRPALARPAVAATRLP
jgi:heme A synthase